MPNEQRVVSAEHELSSKLKAQSPRLRVGFVLDDGLDSPDGVQQYVLTFGLWLSKQGHEVHYLVGQTARTDIKNIHAIPKNIRVRFNGNRLTIPLPASNKKIKQLLAELNLDVLHVQVPYSPFFGAKVIKNCSPNTLVVGTFHIFPYSTLAYIGTALLGQVLRRNLRRFDQHFSVSSSAQTFARATFGIESEVLSNMVDTVRFKPKKPVKRSNTTLKLLFLGRLVERKGCRLLLEALSEIRKTDPNLMIHLDICGKGTLRPSLEEYVTRHDLSDLVTFHGFVSEADKIQFMQKADIAIFPSYSGESFGIVLIEAMAAGSGVVLGGKNPGYSSVLSDVPESIIAVKNTAQFAHSLREIIFNKHLRDQIHTKQELLVKRFDVASVGGVLLAAYTDGIRQKRAKEGVQANE